MNTESVVLSKKNTTLIIWTLLSLFPIIGMAVDLVAPSLPAISKSLDISNSVAKNVITIYLVGYALGNFVTGFLTDAFGRKKLIRLSLFLFILVSLIPTFFSRIDLLLLSRFLQGLSIGAVSVLARAIFADILPAEKLVRLGTLIATMWGLGPIVGPVIGGYLQFYFDWQAGFYFFASISFIMFIITWMIVPETHFNRYPLKIATIKKNILEVIRNRLFISAAMLMGLSYSLLVIFNISGPFLIQTEFHHTPIFFGHLALCLGFVFLISTFICRFMLKKITVEKLFFFSINLFTIIAALSVAISYFFTESILLISIISALMFFACGLIFPPSMGKGISLFRHIAGTATAVMYLINILISSLVSFLASLINVHNNFVFVSIYLSLMIFISIIYWTMIHTSLNSK